VIKQPISLSSGLHGSFKEDFLDRYADHGIVKRKDEATGNTYYEFTDPVVFREVNHTFLLSFPIGSGYDERFMLNNVHFFGN
jgi:hypothetical protein